MDPTSNVLTVNVVLGAFATVLLLLSSNIMKAMWSEIKQLRDRSHDHANLLQNHEGRLDGHEDDIRDIKGRIFNKGA